ncbi:hypothetical protein KAU33_11335, partial [Candidatus Dependentiae bacterium]|nr:hypothetical protein [Candidatus Dependentiae bacterium]
MKKLKILIVLTVISYFFLGCTGLTMSIKVDEESNKQDITKYFVKMNKNLRKFQEEERIENITLIIKTNKYNKRNNIKLIFSFENNETTEYILKTNYPNEIEYDMKRMNKKLKRVECINLDKEEKFLIEHISFCGYHISFGSLGGYVKQIYPHVTASDFLINKINSFFSVKDFILFDKENNIYINKNRKNPPPKDYINNCKKLKEILETDFKWLNDDWDLNFVLTSSINYIDNHCFPLNYIVIYVPEEGYGDNFWQPVNQAQRIHVVLHEIIEANIHISTNINIIKTRFFYEGLAEYLSKAVIKKMNPTANFYIAYNDYEEIKKIEQEEINLKKIKYIVPKPKSSKNAYYASQYIWERLAHDYKVDSERIFEIFQEENSLENFLKHYKMLITIISQESGISIEKVEGLLKVNVSEMIGFYDKKYGFDSKYKDMVLVSLRSPYKDELKDHNFFIDKYEVSNE